MVMRQSVAAIVARGRMVQKEKSHSKHGTYPVDRSVIVAMTMARTWTREVTIADQGLQTLLTVNEGTLLRIVSWPNCVM